ncbi:predicted protein [Postia placenta Mad-698-R]|nr:predicted protein [Postia placenta Mad-698-R]
MYLRPVKHSYVSIVPFSDVLSQNTINTAKNSEKRTHHAAGLPAPEAMVVGKKKDDAHCQLGPVMTSHSGHSRVGTPPIHISVTGPINVFVFPSTNANMELQQQLALARCMVSVPDQSTPSVGPKSHKRPLSDPGPPLGNRWAYTQAATVTDTMPPSLTPPGQSQPVPTDTADPLSSDTSDQQPAWCQSEEHVLTHSSGQRLASRLTPHGYPMVAVMGAVWHRHAVHQQPPPHATNPVCQMNPARQTKPPVTSWYSV